MDTESPLFKLTESALAGLSSRPGAGHLDPHEAAAIGKRAVELATATLAALEDAATEPAKPAQGPKPARR